MKELLENGNAKKISQGRPCDEATCANANHPYYIPLIVPLFVQESGEILSETILQFRSSLFRYLTVSFLFVSLFSSIQKTTMTRKLQLLSELSISFQLKVLTWGLIHFKLLLLKDKRKGEMKWNKGKGKNLR